MRIYSKKNVIVIALFFYCHSLVSIQSAVTYDFSGGRFGDCLVSYCHAKWISYLYNIPLLYKPFSYSDQLSLHQLEIMYTPDLAQQFLEIIALKKNAITVEPERGALYIVPYFPESIFDREDKIFPYLFDTDWDNCAFKNLLKEMISPLLPIKILQVPKNVLSVAVHVRKGTGWDIPNYRITPAALTASHPLRFAPDSFFINQLKAVAKMFPDTQIYVYLFTDHNDPASLANQFQQAVHCDRMRFDYRIDLNNEFINVLDDFFALTLFDCLIRADSNFSGIASKIGDYKIIMTPWHGVVMDGDTVIDEIKLEITGLSFIIKQ